MIFLFKYVKGAPRKGLIDEDKGYIDIVGNSNVDWAGFPADRHSTSGYCIFIGGNLIS